MLSTKRVQKVHLSPSKALTDATIPSPRHSIHAHDRWTNCVGFARRKCNAPPRRHGFASEIWSPHFSRILYPLSTRVPLTYVPLPLRSSNTTWPVAAKFERMRQWSRDTYAWASPGITSFVEGSRPMRVTLSHCGSSNRRNSPDNGTSQSLAGISWPICVESELR